MILWSIDHFSHCFLLQYPKRSITSALITIKFVYISSCNDVCIHIGIYILVYWSQIYKRRKRRRHPFTNQTWWIISKFKLLIDSKQNKQFGKNNIKSWVHHHQYHYLNQFSCIYSEFKLETLVFQSIFSIFWMKLIY